MRTASDAAHLVRRFVANLDPRGPEPASEAWAVRHLSAAELVLWQSMGGPDRRHSLGVAVEAVSRLGERPELVRAALMHDVGKVGAGLGLMGRVVATVVEVAGLQEAVRRSHVRSGRWAGLVAYADYPETGAALLRDAGSPELVWRWAAEHHMEQQQWTVAPDVGAVLADCDDC